MPHWLQKRESSEISAWQFSHFIGTYVSTAYTSDCVDFHLELVDEQTVMCGHFLYRNCDELHQISIDPPASISKAAIDAEASNRTRFSLFRTLSGIHCLARPDRITLAQSRPVRSVHAICIGNPTRRLGLAKDRSEPRRKRIQLNYR